MKNSHFYPTLILGAACLLLTATTASAEKMVMDFKKTTKPLPEVSRIVNDGVMGGLSTSQIKPSPDGGAIFSGVVSLENNGGFASVRLSPAVKNLKGHDAFVLRIKGDGKRYKFRARTSQGFDVPSYQAAFATKAGQWQDIRIAFKDFLPTWRGRVLKDRPNLDPAKVTSLGFLISDKQEGPFRLEIAHIKATTMED